MSTKSTCTPKVFINCLAHFLKDGQQNFRFQSCLKQRGQVDLNYGGDLKSQARGIVVRWGLSGDRSRLHRIDDSDVLDTGVLVTVPPCTRGLMGSGLPGRDWLWSRDSWCWWRNLAGLGQLQMERDKDKKHNKYIVCQLLKVAIVHETKIFSC